MIPPSDSNPRVLSRRSVLSRRTVLQGAGLSLALPLLQRDVQAVSPTVPAIKRMVFVANPLGFVANHFFPTEPGPMGNLPPLLEPLAGMKDRFSVFSHLDHGTTGGHQGVHAFLSGVRDNESSGYLFRNLTVDQRAAELVGGDTRYPSLVASAGWITGELECRTSWTRNGVNVPPVTRASMIFDALFVDDDAKSREARRIAMIRNASVLDAMRESASSLDRKLGAADRRKLDEYLTSIRSVEQRLQVSGQWIDRPKPKVDLARPRDDVQFTARLPLFYDLIRLALQTDSTRVATLSVPGNLPVVDLGLKGNYHAFSHHGKNERLLEPLLVIERYQMEQFARFLQSLTEVEVAGGGTLLDHTMVLSGSGMGNASSHSNRDLPIVLAGGDFKHGKHHVMPTESHRRVPLSNLFTTMLQKFGDQETDRFNRATGALEV